jgi:hypothetical protein
MGRSNRGRERTIVALILNVFAAALKIAPFVPIADLGRGADTEEHAGVYCFGRTAE